MIALPVNFSEGQGVTNSGPASLRKISKISALKCVFRDFLQQNAIFITFATKVKYFMIFEANTTLLETDLRLELHFLRQA